MSAVGAAQFMADLSWDSSPARWDKASVTHPRGRDWGLGAERWQLAEPSQHKNSGIIFLCD